MRVRTAAANCLSSLVVEVVKREAHANRIRRERETREHHLLINSLTRAMEAGLRRDVCPDFVRTQGDMGACKNKYDCGLVHELVGVHLIPPSKRFFMVTDSFPEQRESSMEKQMVNNELVVAASQLSKNPRCLVLDGPRCHSTKALLLCKLHCRTNDMIVVGTPPPFHHTPTTQTRTNTRRPE